MMNEKIYFKMEGPAFLDNMPLHTVLAGLSELQNIVDRTYLVLSERQRISSGDRESYRLVAHGFGRGSFWSEIEIFCVVTQLMLPFVSQLTPKTLWEFTKEAFAFLKLVLSRSREGRTPSIEASEEGTVNVCYGGNQTFNFNAPVIQIGKQVLPHYQHWTQLVEREGVKEISMGDRNTPEIRIGRDDTKLFNQPSDLIRNAITLRCEIFDFNKYKNSGKLAVASGQAVPEGQYGFSVVGTEDYVQFVRSMLKTSVIVECIQEMTHNALGERVIAGLQVLRVLAKGHDD
ncbi:MAG TPA: hypothetical protein VMX13_00695 [Sedimentisphaerales bacterium]|nr:hypothetical protein [Sedimentisphaerales bacterium]